jgi:hypothetical protein
MHRSCGACGRSLGEETVAQTAKRAAAAEEEESAPPKLVLAQAVDARADRSRRLCLVALGQPQEDGVVARGLCQRHVVAARSAHRNRRRKEARCGRNCQQVPHRGTAGALPSNRNPGWISTCEGRISLCVFRMFIPSLSW